MVKRKGTRGPDPTAGVDVTAGRPDMPKGLTKAAQVEWDWICKEAEATSVLCEEDRAALIAYIANWQDEADARAQMKEYGGRSFKTTTIQGGETYKIHPLSAVVQTCQRFTKAWLDAFGLNPKARGQVREAKEAAGKDEKNLDNWKTKRS